MIGILHDVVQHCRNARPQSLHSAQVVDPEPAAADEIHQPIKTSALRSRLEHRQPRDEPARVHREHHRLQQRQVVSVVRAVDKHAPRMRSLPGSPHAADDLIVRSLRIGFTRSLGSSVAG